MESIDIKAIFKLLWDKIWLLVLGLVVGALAMFGYTKLMVRPTYTSSVQFYCIGVPGAVSTSEMNARGTLAETYSKLLTSDVVLSPVAELLEGDMTVGKLRGMISVSVDGETGLLSVAITSGDPQLSVATCRYVIDVAPGKLNNITEGGKLKVISDTTGTIPSGSIPYSKNVTMGAIAGLALMVVLVILIDLLDTTVSDEQRLRQRLDVPILGEIPEFEHGTSKRNRYVYSYGRRK